MKIVIGRGSCGIAAGANKAAEILTKVIEENHLNVEITQAGCIGTCYLEPIIDVIDDAGGKTTYVKVTEDVAAEIGKRLSGQPNSAGENEISDADRAFLSRQTRIALRNCGLIDPEKIGDAIANGGYTAIQKALKLKPTAIIEELKLSGLGGRGGAGFPTWFKWNAAMNAQGNKKYVICNADEGDPGAFMDRALIEGDPHSLIEGMLIAAYVIGADEGVVYVRAEYPLAIKRLQTAIDAAETRGFLGENILGSGFSFRLRIKAGAGAFVCGEETALIASLEGERGMPRLKPPFPAEKGFWQKPSNINNVETYANVPWILLNGGAALSALGTANSKGTKVFALTGKIQKGGLVEVPMGMKIREVIDDIGGGIKNGRGFKAVQMGGPSGGCIPLALIDTVIDYQSVVKTGAIMGSGGMVVMDESTCMVEMARFFLEFTKKESCGKCTHCRIGTQRMLEILTRITEGQGKPGDIGLLEDLAEQIKNGALCGLGNSAPNPVLTTIKYFRNEYEDHIHHKKCTAKQCKPLLTYTVDAEKCTGCTLCARSCPAKAIAGAVKQTHTVDQPLCVKCGKCAAVCRFGAVSAE
ncbi:MAG: 4Fe-4S binding protein [Clostridiales bacterium]|jgi:NADH-quinone oxidoreductase subunit F|nr:4Fe-4S binding protein [Clostridiales bacterium]